MHAAAQQLAEAESRALLLFYAAECGLKALYLQKFRLKDTSSTNASAREAAYFNHRLDSLIVALRVAPQTLPPRPSELTLRSGTAINVDTLHQAWRYGAPLATEQPVIGWLEKVIEYALKEL